MTTDDKIPDAPLPDDSYIETVLARLYSPDKGYEPEEVLSHTDVLNAVRNLCSECDSQTLFRVMDDFEFPSRTIDGVLYWFVKTPSV